MHRAWAEAKREEITELIDLGVFDSDIATNTIKGDLRGRRRQAAELEKKMGMGLGSTEPMEDAGRQGEGAAKGQVASSRRLLHRADNCWKYFNYRIELAKQQWIHEGMRRRRPALRR